MLEGVRRLALVGVAKNCGKTTTLNYLLSCGVCDGRTVGLVSIGIDGESADLLIGTKKPPINVVAGQWVVTARDALAKSSARIEYVASLGFSTPLGEVVAGRVIEGGTIVLAGMRHAGDLAEAVEVLEAHGVDLVIIDGAYGRTVAARSQISDAIIVSTGAVLSEQLDVICTRTVRLIERLAAPAVEANWQRSLIERAIAEDRSLLGGEAIAPIELPASSALVGLRDAGALWTEQVQAIAVPGLVSDSVVEHLLAVNDVRRTLLVPDGTVLQVSRRLMRRFLRRWEIRALHSACILAVSVNPTGVQGQQVDSDALIDGLRERLRMRWSQVAVFDPLAAS